MTEKRTCYTIRVAYNINTEQNYKTKEYKIIATNDNIACDEAVNINKTNFINNKNYKYIGLAIINREEVYIIK